MKISIISLWIQRVLFISLSTTLSSWGQESSLVEFDHFTDNTIYFRAPPPRSPATQPPPASPSTSPSPLSPSLKAYKTTLSDLSYLGMLRPSGSNDGEPYFLFTGKECATCSDERKIYAIRPSLQKPAPFVYPGKIFEPRTRALVLDSHAFFGKCLPRRGDILVIFQKEKVDRRAHLQSSVLIAEPTQSYLSETLLERHLPSLQTALQAVKRKTCYKIDGRNRVMASKASGLGIKSSISIEDSDDNDDDNNDNKENKENKDNKENPGT